MPDGAESSDPSGSTSAAADAHTQQAKPGDSRIAPGTTVSSLDGLTVMVQPGASPLTTGELECILCQSLSAYAVLLLTAQSELCCFLFPDVFHSPPLLPRKLHCLLPRRPAIQSAVHSLQKGLVGPVLLQHHISL